MDYSQWVLWYLMQVALPYALGCIYDSSFGDAICKK